MGKCDKVLMAQKGDDNAFYELIEERKEKLYRTALIYVKNEQIALDIIGETVYKAYKGLRKLRHLEYFDTWLIRILINTSNDYLKKNKKVVEFSEEILVNKLGYEETGYDRIDIFTAVDSLDEKHKTIIILKYYQDLTITQIGDLLGLPPGTVKTYLHRALKKLRIEFEEECYNE